ncbi:MAG: aspartate aminotransferase family protein [Caldilineaceae bacterium]|nr:aspartate aminotransferase family protein [Caldilineaceae bacterium]
MKTYSQSKALYERAGRALAGGVSSEFRKASWPHPLFYASAQGSRIVDVDENEYLDFTLSQGPLILGHSHPEVLERVERTSRAGQLFAGQHLMEVELAELMQQYVPCAELVRFSLSGSEADHTALRVARAVTGRPKFIRFEGHYHGWFDNVAWSIGAASVEALGPAEHPTPAPWTAGLPARAVDEFIVLPWNNLALVEQTLAERHAEVAAILTEPVMCNSGCIEPAPGFLAGLRHLCDQYDIALIFDEVITGFRLGMGGAQGHYGVTPDLAVFAKAMANGYPISAVAGKRRWMQPIADGAVIHAGTMNSSNPTVAAALATLTILARDGVHERLFIHGQRLMAGLRNAAEEYGLPLLVQGPGPMFHTAFTTQTTINDYRDTLSFDRARLGAFIQQMQERGVRLIGRGLWYLSAAHTDADIDQGLEAARAVLREMSEER